MSVVANPNFPEGVKYIIPFDLVSWCPKGPRSFPVAPDAYPAPLLHQSTPSSPLPTSDTSLISSAALIALTIQG